MSTRPDTVAIDADDYHARYVGKTAEGHQFFVTTPFVPAINGAPGREFVARFMFDAAGSLIEADIVDLGVRSELNADVVALEFQGQIDALASPSYERIVIRPFELERFGITFGLIAVPPDDDRDCWTVEVHPGNYMAFSEPWDSGEYDT